MNIEKKILNRFVPIYVNRYDMIPGEATREIQIEIEKIKNRDLEFMINKVNHKNPCVAEIFTILTGIPTKDKEEVETALPKLGNTKALWKTCLDVGYMPLQTNGKWLMTKENGDTIRIPDRKTYRLCVAETIQSKILRDL